MINWIGVALVRNFHRICFFFQSRVEFSCGFVPPSSSGRCTTAISATCTHIYIYIIYIYNELTPPEILRLVGGDFPGKSPNMRLVVVEQLHKT